MQIRVLICLLNVVFKNTSKVMLHGLPKLVKKIFVVFLNFLNSKTIRRLFQLNSVKQVRPALLTDTGFHLPFLCQAVAYPCHT